MKGYLPPRLLQIVGLILLVGFSVFWAWTGEQSALFLTASMTLVLLGTQQEVINKFKKSAPAMDIDKEENAGKEE